MFVVVFSCDPRIDENRFIKNKDLASLLSAKPIGINTENFINMIMIEISDIDDCFDEKFQIF